MTSLFIRASHVFLVGLFIDAILFLNNFGELLEIIVWDVDMFVLWFNQCKSIVIDIFYWVFDPDVCSIKQGMFHQYLPGLILDLKFGNIIFDTSFEF